MPVILATWEAVIERNGVWDLLSQIVLKTQPPKEPDQNGLEVWLKRESLGQTPTTK
jgi:hypothetical protein